jgi:hypothetical protein
MVYAAMLPELLFSGNYLSIFLEIKNKLKKILILENRKEKLHT